MELEKKIMDLSDPFSDRSAVCCTMEEKCNAIDYSSFFLFETFPLCRTNLIHLHKLLQLHIPLLILIKL